MIDLEKARQVHYVVLQIQRRMRRARAQYELGIEASEVIILSMLSGSEKLTASGLAEISGIARYSLVRVLKKLEKKGYLSSFKTSFDRRSCCYEFTKKGRKLLDKIYQTSNEASLRTFSALSAEELTNYGFFARQLADSLNCPPRIPNSNELFILTQQHRFVLGTGMLSDSYLNTQVSLPEYQMFFTISQRQTFTRFKELLQDLPFHPSKLSRSLAAFTRKGLLSKKPDIEDGRGTLFGLTDKGQDWFKKIDDYAAQVYQRALAKFKDEEIDPFLTLSLKIIGSPLPLPYARQDETKTPIAQRINALSAAESLESKLLLFKNPLFAFSFHREHKIRGLLIISKKCEVEFFEYTCSSETNPDEEEQEVFRQAVLLFFQQSKKQKLIVPKPLARRLGVDTVIEQISTVTKGQTKKV